MVRIKQFRRVWTPGMKEQPEQFRIIEHDEDLPLPGRAHVLEDQDTPLAPEWTNVEEEA